MDKIELEQIVELLQSFPPINLDDLALVREKMNAMGEAVPLPDGVSTEALVIEGVPIEWCRHDKAVRDKAFLYLHGGAYMLGSIRSHRPLIAEIVKQSGFNCLAVDYRLAPEDPFPAALYDVQTVYRYLLAEGFNRENIGIVGDSAGGGLALASLLALREAGYPQPAFGILICPWLDLTMSGESLERNKIHDPLIDKETLLAAAAAYLCGQAADAPLVSPLFADLNGLAPLLVQVGTHEALLDDSVRLEALAKYHDIDITLERWEEMVHVWHALFDSLPEGRQAIERIGQFMKACWA
jgi:acetyl esterase/lipase